MPDDSLVATRKSDHIRINLEKDVQSSLTNGLEKYQFIHQALPDLDLSEINPEQQLFGKKVKIPILISSMTGGTNEAQKINEVLAVVAQEFGFAMGVGSQRAGLELPETAASYQVRRLAPKILLFANLGAVQLNLNYSVEDCQRAVDMIEADGLILHLNPLQEALQPEGDTTFRGLIARIAMVCRYLPVPVIIKEVGWGIAENTAKSLFDAGVTAIDVAGAGGTSWSQVEMYREPNPNRVIVASAFRNWGIPTADSILMVKKANPDGIVFASGGLQNGIDILKCIALGAKIGGIARPFLRVAVDGWDAAYQLGKNLVQQIRVGMFVIGAKSLSELGQDRIRKIG